MGIYICQNLRYTLNMYYFVYVSFTLRNRLKIKILNQMC